MGTSVAAFVGHFVGVLEGLKTGKSTLVGPVVGDLVGALVTLPPVGQGSLSPALCVAHPKGPKIEKFQDLEIFKRD